MPQKLDKRTYLYGVPPCIFLSSADEIANHPDHSHVNERDVGFLHIYRLQRKLLDELALLSVPVGATFLNNTILQQLISPQIE